MEILLGLILILIALVSLVVLFFIFKFVSTQSKNRYSNAINFVPLKINSSTNLEAKTHRKANNYKTISNQSTSVKTQPSQSGKKSKVKTNSPNHLKVKLLKQLNGNSATAERLIAHLRVKYPEKPEQWYWEKAIFDLERDRH